MSDELQRNQPCGCIVCVCEDTDQCHGCGAKHCGTHPLGEIPNPVYIPMTPHALAREKLQEYLDIFRADGNCEQLILDEFETLRQALTQQAQEVETLRKQLRESHEDF